MGKSMGFVSRLKMRPATLVRVGAVVLALLLVSAMTLGRSQSAFTATTKYGETSKLGAANMSLSSVGSKTLELGNMVPGDRITVTVLVTYDGTADPATLDQVRVYGNDTTGAGGLGQWLNVSGEMGDGDTLANPGTFRGIAPLGRVNSIFGSHGTYENAYTTGWAPHTKGEARPFRFTFELAGDATNDAQGKTSTPVITWEIRTKEGTRVR